MFWSIIVAVFTFGWMILAVVRYRQGVEPLDNCEKITPGVFPKERENFKLELAWFIVPTILIIWLSYISWTSMISVWGDMPEDEDAFVVRVEATQWSWAFQYEDNLTYYQDDGSLFTMEEGNYTYGNLYVPCGEDIKFKIYSLGSGDQPAVQHAPFLIEWGAKEDAVPSPDPEFYTTMFFHPEETGTFPMLCAEYCGLQHSIMTAYVHVVNVPNKAACDAAPNGGGY